MFVFGSGVKTAMIGKNPSLTDLDNNNLKMQTDFRQVYAAILKDWFGTSVSAESATIFRDFAAAPIFQRVTTTSESASSDDGVRLYPNPAASDVVLEADSLPAALTSVQMTDMQGRLLMLSASASAGALRFNVGSLPQGQYIVHVGTQQGVINKRLIVAR